MSRNPIARDLRTPKYRMRVITNNRRIDRMAAYADLQAQYLEALDNDDDEALEFNRGRNGRVQRRRPLPLTDHDAYGHPAYEGGVARAVKHAQQNPGQCFSVYYDGKAIYVRSSTDAKPENAKLVCIAQQWNDRTVQLRFDGARSEWVNV